MALRRPMLTRMAGEQPRRPQFVGIAEVLGLAAGEVDNPCLGLGGGRRLPAGPRSIVERRHRANLGGELPVGLGVMFVTVVLPSGDFDFESVLVRNAAAQTLA